MENLLTLTYDSTHYYLLDYGKGKLLIDAGMPGTLAKFQGQLKTYGVRPAEIRYVMMTHSHPDHAGILQEVKRLCGAKLIIHEMQAPYLAELRAFIAKKGGSNPLEVEPGDLVVGTPNREALRSIGIQGEIVETPGHSPDSVTLLLDSGLAFIGDLNPLYALDPENGALTLESWKKLLAMNIKQFYPAHANPVPAGDVKKMLGI